MSLVGRLAGVASKYRHARTLYRSEFKRKMPIDWGRRIGFWKDGFLTESALQYRFDDRNVDRSEYLSDWQREIHTSAINRPYEFVLDNKLAFDRFLRPLVPDMLPDLYGLMDTNGQVLTDGRRTPIDPMDWLSALLQSRGAVVVKPIDGGAGIGVMMLKYSGGRLTINSREGELDAVRMAVTRTDSPLLAFRMLDQHPYSAAIYPDSVNTMRILMMIDPASGHPFIARAAHRFGSSRSEGMDNVSRGGITAAIDLNTGVMGPGAMLTDSGPAWHEIHPDTGSSIAGSAIPGWETLRSAMLDLHESLSFVPYIGWDVLMTPEGPMIIEGNRYSGVSMLQVHEPLLRDPRIRAFYRHHGVT